ncbi:MAG TPA: FecR domain-containing protein [Mucilaginibacter sp.]|jgi:ferric-dicitrate binding protein FerR (iron transport regulator)|nr:FecR domain-containing protein [Mucilaginibacter sp.]
MSKNKIADLLARYQSGQCTPEEKALVDEWFASHGSEQTSIEQMNAEEQDAWATALFSEISRTNQDNEVKIIPIGVHRRIWPRIAIAASFLLFLSVGGYLFLNRQKSVKQLASNQPIDIKPGGNKAILTLSNGHAISLTDAKNGKVAAQGNNIVNKTAAGVIAYASSKSTDAEKAAVPLYNTLTTPRGGRFEGILPDGTHVILDAASSIKYQVNITGKDRLVWITGQVHFNVIYNAIRPFYVNVKGQVMKDLGTAFNINAYDDEPVIRVTLEEGSINVSKGRQSAVLIPGQQAITKTTNDLIKVEPVNVDDVLAWTKGQTSFQDENIQEIMRKVSRWYDVDVRYEGQIPTRQFDGSISRDANLSDLLKVLEFNNIHFTISGKTITVKP